MTPRLKFRLRFTLSLVLLCLPLASFASFLLSADHPNLLARQAKLYFAGTEAAPATAHELPNWLAQRKPAGKISLFGGAYWLYAEVSNPTQNGDWVIDPDGRLIERVDLSVYGPGQTVQTVRTGYRARHDYLMHYGKGVRLPPGTRAQVLMRVESPYYAAAPNLLMATQPSYAQHALREGVWALLALGALLTLALYNLFIYGIHSDRAHFYYALYLLAYFAGWALTFQLPADLFGWHDLRVHYVPFFLLPVLNTLFYMEFLQLKRHFPRLAAISRVNLILPLLLLPSCFFALPYAHALATVVIGVWLCIALTCGIASLRSGFRPARYFVPAFMALLIPGLIILPANVGLVPSLVDNPELVPFWAARWTLSCWRSRWQTRSAI